MAQNLASPASGYVVHQCWVRSLLFDTNQKANLDPSDAITAARFSERKKKKSLKMRKFNAWLVFFKREWNWNWPFLVGFAITGILITKFSLCLTGVLILQRRMRRTRLLYRGTRTLVQEVVVKLPKML